MVVTINDRGPFVRGRVIDVFAGGGAGAGFHRACTGQYRQRSRRSMSISHARALTSIGAQSRRPEERNPGSCAGRRFGSPATRPRAPARSMKAKAARVDHHAMAVGAPLAPRRLRIQVLRPKSRRGAAVPCAYARDASRNGTTLSSALWSAGLSRLNPYVIGVSRSLSARRIRISRKTWRVCSQYVCVHVAAHERRADLSKISFAAPNVVLSAVASWPKFTGNL